MDVDGKRNFLKILVSLENRESLAPYDFEALIDGEREKRNFASNHIQQDRYFIDKHAETLYRVVMVDENCEGPVGYVHGGFSASLLDQNMGRTVLALRGMSATVRLEVDYRRPLKTKDSFQIRSWIEEETERKIVMNGTILDSADQLCVEALGVFVKMNLADLLLVGTMQPSLENAVGYKTIFKAFGG
ncbi:hypothetical protein NDN08_007661 [Rhodosorus marinus]|uniref:Thioesterase domain-containing protein n=1 Tax=Rhodosorus marinus TaxID=101924 RepID=A0AAV8UY72_9RHOD|nr:hypothetical protein NDN08_007661 [Rhodosorus marinus]